MSLILLEDILHLVAKVDFILSERLSVEWVMKLDSLDFLFDIVMMLSSFHLSWSSVLYSMYKPSHNLLYEHSVYTNDVFHQIGQLCCLSLSFSNLA